MFKTLGKKHQRTRSLGRNSYISPFFSLHLRSPIDDGAIKHRVE